MKNFKPRKSVKRFICETLISALVLTVILGIIYYQERLWVLAMVLIFILDVLFCMFEEIKAEFNLQMQQNSDSVSYTHLTLPTSDLV